MEYSTGGSTIKAVAYLLDIIIMSKKTKAEEAEKLQKID